MVEAIFWMCIGSLIHICVRMIIEYRNTVFGKFKINSTDIEADVYHITLGQPIIPGRTKYINLEIEDDSRD